MAKKEWKKIVGENDEDGDQQSETGILEKIEVAEPSFYKVILLNDDFTPMEFVTHILQKVFNKAADEAHRVMMEVHTKGKGIAGVFSYEIAETKVFMTNNYAKQSKYPLKCTMEKE